MLRISPEFLIDQIDITIPLKTVSQYCITWFLIAVRQAVKIIDNSLVVHELELAIKPDLYGLLLSLGNQYTVGSINKYTKLNSHNEPVHEISNNLVCATSKASDQPAHTRSLIRAFASRLSFL